MSSKFQNDEKLNSEFEEKKIDEQNEFMHTFEIKQPEDSFENNEHEENLSQPSPKRQSIISITKKEDEDFHNLKFSLLYLISFFITCISCVYYYSYNNFNNRIILDYKEYLNTDFPFYKITSKYTKGRIIYINLQLNTTNHNEELLSTYIKVVFIFASEIVHIKIFTDLLENYSTESLYDMSDPYLNSTNIDNYKESNIGIKFYDYPFNFRLFRKDDGNTLFDSRCEKNQNLIFFFS